MAITNGFLCEPEPGLVCHSRTSRLLVSDPSFMNWARWMTNYSVPTAYKLPDATERWGKTEAKNETAFNLAMEMSQPFFDYLRKDAKLNTMFSSYMRNVASTAGISFVHLAKGFNWAGLGTSSTVVDVGGSGGHASLALAKEFQHLNFIVQDLPETIANSKQAIARDETNSDNAALSRVRFMEHDFFQPEPVVDADVYLLRMIIHDWPDSEAIKILGHLKKAMQKPGARIVIMDTVLPQPSTIPLLQERQLRVRDLTMMQVFNAKERELEDWKALVHQAGLEILHVEQPPGSVMGILQVGLPVGSAAANGVSGAVKVNGNSASNGERLAGTNGTVNGLHGNLDDGVSQKSDALANGHTNGSLSATQERSQALNGTVTSKAPPVLIIGAGIGGLCLAQGLRKAGREIIVFERDLSEAYRPQGYRLKLESDAAEALQDCLPESVYRDFQASCAVSAVGETDFDPISGSIIRSRAGGGLAGQQGLRASYTADRSVLRSILMTGIEDKVVFGKELASYTIDKEAETVSATFKDGTHVKGSFLVGADGVRSTVRKQLLPEHKFVDTGAMCIYGKTPITQELLAQYPAKGLRWMTVCADRAPLIQSILIDDSPLTLLSEPIRFDAKSRVQRDLPADYVYWVLIGRKEIFVENGAKAAEMAAAECGPDESARLSLELTKEWDPSLRSLFQLQDVRQCSTLRVVSATPEAPSWEASANVTLIGDAIHAMSPCGGVGANTALRDAAELAKAIGAGKDNPASKSVGLFEEDMRKRAFKSLMRSFAGSKKMFDQRPFHELQVLDI